MTPVIPPTTRPATSAANKIATTMKVDRTICPRLVNLTAVLLDGRSN
jgi:hypothetical protein